MRTDSQTNFARVCGSWAERLLLAGESPGGASALHRLSAAREHLLHTPFVPCPSLKAFPISGILGLHCRGFFTGEGNAPSQWGQQAYLRFSRRPRSAPALAAASFRLPRRSSLPVGCQQPWFSWVDLGSVGLPLSSPSHGGPCKASRKLGAVSQTRSGFITKSMQQISSLLLGMVIENHTTNTSDPERLDGRWGKRVTVTLDLCSVSQTVWAPTHDNVLCCMRLYPIKRGCLHPKRSLVPASF